MTVPDPLRTDDPREGGPATTTTTSGSASSSSGSGPAGGADVNATASLLRSNQESIVAEAMSYLAVGGESTSPAANGQQQQYPPQHGGGGSSAAGSLAARIGGAAGSIGGYSPGPGGGPSWYENVASQAGSLARKTATTLQDAAARQREIIEPKKMLELKD